MGVPRDPRLASSATNRSKVAAAAFTLGVAVVVGVAAGILSSGAKHPSQPLVNGLVAAGLAGALCLVIWERRTIAARQRFRWRDLEPEAPWYPAWKEMRARGHLFRATLFGWIAVVVLVQWLALRAQQAALEIAHAGTEASIRLDKARCAVGAAKWQELGLEPTPNWQDLNQVTAMARDLCGAQLALWIAGMALSVTLFARSLASPCPRCGAPFLLRPRRRHVWMAFGAPLIPSLLFLAVAAWVLSKDYGGLLLMFLPRIFVPTFSGVACGCMGLLSIERYRDSYARKHGDPDWKWKVGQQCVHCGLDAWTPSGTT